MGFSKAMQAYRDLKSANNLLTFEAMAASPQNKSLIAIEAAKRAQARNQILKSSNLQIQADKQGKHIVGYNNYIAMRNRSILEHSDPQRLVNDFAGKGIKVNTLPAGVAGYQEIVDFGEFIGYSVDRETGNKIATNWGKIHYAKDGVHIVPTEPR